MKPRSKHNRLIARLLSACPGLSATGFHSAILREASRNVDTYEDDESGDKFSITGVDLWNTDEGNLSKQSIRDDVPIFPDAYRVQWRDNVLVISMFEVSVASKVVREKREKYAQLFSLTDPTDDVEVELYDVDEHGAVRPVDLAWLYVNQIAISVDHPNKVASLDDVDAHGPVIFDIWDIAGNRVASSEQMEAA